MRIAAPASGCVRRPWAMMVLAVFALWALFAAPAAAAQAAQDGHAIAAPRIGVMTMQPGEIFFERFGHNAIVVDDPFEGATSYNYGFFDPAEPDFIARFVRGDMRYRLLALPLAEDLVYYRDVGRGVSIQWLDLEPVEAATLAARLAENARPENAHYRYDYFTDNCSTRVRDAIDGALGGTLAARLQSRSQGNTYRSEAVRLASPAPWMWLGFDIGLGPAADRPNSLWEDAFVPMRLASSLRTMRLDDGRPLVQAEERLLPHRIDPEPAESRRAWWPWLLAGFAGAAVVLAAAHRRPRAVAGAAVGVWLLCTLVAALMLFIWFGTAHRFGWANHNLLLASPACLLLLPGAWRLARGRAPGRLFQVALAVLAASVAAAPFLYWLPLAPQRNAHWIALLLPLQLAFVLALWPRPARQASDAP
jgi:hypothetical protein